MANSTQTQFKVKTFLEMVREKTTGGGMIKWGRFSGTDLFPVNWAVQSVHFKGNLLEHPLKYLDFRVLVSRFWPTLLLGYTEADYVLSNFSLYFTNIEADYVQLQFSLYLTGEQRPARAWAWWEDVQRGCGHQRRGVQEGKCQFTEKVISAANNDSSRLFTRSNSNHCPALSSRRSLCH